MLNQINMRQERFKSYGYCADAAVKGEQPDSHPMSGRLVKVGKQHAERSTGGGFACEADAFILLKGIAATDGYANGGRAEQSSVVVWLSARRANCKGRR